MEPTKREHYIHGRMIPKVDFVPIQAEDTARTVTSCYIDAIRSLSPQPLAEHYSKLKRVPYDE